MRKLNSPGHPVRTVKVTNPPGVFPDHEGEWRVEVREQRGELIAYDEWIKPWTRVREAYDGFMGRSYTVQQIMGSRPSGFFRAKWIDNEWQFLKYLPNTHYDW